MNLVIDIGNSSIKSAIFRNGDIVERDVNTAALSQYNIRQTMVCSTRHHDPQLWEMLQRQVPKVITFDHTTPIPLKNGYLTPETLGADRLAAAVGAWSISPSQELLIFDLGTALTVDYVSAAGCFIGGNISLGLALRFQALHQLTARLPLCAAPDNPANTWGDTTQTAIENGVITGMVNEIKGYILENPEKKVFFTGRDANYFAERLKNTIFVDCELVLKGLNRILEYNAEK